MLWHADVKDDSANSGNEKVESGQNKTDSSSVSRVRTGSVAVAEGEGGEVLVRARAGAIEQSGQIGGCPLFSALLVRIADNSPPEDQEPVQLNSCRPESCPSRIWLLSTGHNYRKRR
jgi:hypothetical protein